MGIAIRPLDYETDLPEVVALHNQSYAEQITPETIREWQRNMQAGGVRHRLCAVNEQGAIIGYGHAVRDPFMADGLYWLNVVVDQAHRNRGYGQQLYQTLVAYVSERGATHLRAEVRDDHPEYLRFAKDCGFQIERHLFESTLDLATFDESRFAGAVERIEASGIRFFSVADLGNTEEAQRKLWEINTRTGNDVPGGSSDARRPFEVFQQQVCGASWYRADGEILAADGEQIIGLSALGYFENADGPYMFVMMTGVDRAYRGRGIALALKLVAIRCARRYQAKFLHTSNDAENAPMLAINRKLGFRPDPGNYRLLRPSL